MQNPYSRNFLKKNPVSGETIYSYKYSPNSIKSWWLENFWLAILIFLIGATSQFDLALIGRVPVSELIAFGAIPFLLFGIKIGRYSYRLRLVIGFLILWAAGVLISDFVNGFEGDLFLRGLAKPLWCLLWMLFFTGVLLKECRTLIFLPIGNIVAATQNLYFPQAYTIDRLRGGYDLIAYGYAPIITASCIALATLVYSRSRVFSGLILLLCFLSLVAIGAPRSAAAVYFISMLVILYIAFMASRRGRDFRWTPLRLIPSLIFVFFASFFLFETYVFAASEGWLGELQLQKLREQEATVFGNSLLGLLLTGRAPVYAAILAILDNPLIGFGSGSGTLLSQYYIEGIASVGTDAQLLDRAIASGGGGAGHSILFGIWMENGILAAGSLSIIFFIVATEILRAIHADTRLTPWIVVIGFNFCWAFFFSPFGVGSRLTIGLFLAFYITRFHRPAYILRPRPFQIKPHSH